MKDGSDPSTRTGRKGGLSRYRDLAVFGSVLRPDFGPASDVDLLVTFEPDAEWSLIDHARMEQELTDIIGRKVDLVSRAGLERSPN